MLGSTHNLRWGQRVVAVTLLALYSLFLLIPLAAASTEPAMGPMACCRSGKKCCCRKKSPPNAILSDKSCGGQCGQTAVTAKLTVELFPAATPAAQPALAALTLAAGPTRHHAQRLGPHSLRQRPPPAIA